MKNRVLVLGYFGYVTNQLDGQTVKTRNIYELIKSKTANNKNIEYFDTQEFQKHKLSFFVMVWQIIRCNELIYIPATNNLTFIFPLIFLICKLKRVDILYFVVGGWLANFLKTKKLHVFLLARIQAIFTESKQLRDKLTQQYHFDNVSTFPNFRIHDFVPSFKTNDDVFKIVFMARINRKKGLDAVFRLAEHFEVNRIKQDSICIDFYGPIEKEAEEYFKAKIEQFELTTYRGIVQPEQIYITLCQYDLLVLPTKYPREGFPGSILDAYISGLPVIVSNWKYSPEFVDEGKTGFIFDLEKEEQFYKYVDKLYLDRNFLMAMKKNAYEKSKQYSAESAWGIIEDYVIEI